MQYISEIHEVKAKLLYAKEFNTHKVGYWEEVLKEAESRGIVNPLISYKVFCKDKKDIENRFNQFGISEIKEVSEIFNMLSIKDNQFTAVCEDGKFYLITL